MFYKMIENKAKEWYNSDSCTVKSLIEYIENTGEMRDAQVEAIKIYLFLKIVCKSKSLEVLFRKGCFNTMDLDEIDLSTSTREHLKENPAAAALLEYAMLENERGEQVSEKLAKEIKKNPQGVDYNKVFHDAFYGLSYTDYLFSLPMGAGKTYLMVAFIYLDLYFANNEPANKAFAHNFIIFAPSGLKSSVIPSLKTIQNFNPAWILPEPAASNIKQMISFEVLDQNKADKKSNKTKNPNVQKIANHQPLSELFGLVAVTNAEKVILDRIKEKEGQISFLEESDDEKDRKANELRNLIGKIPSLSIFIDEVHHAVKDEIKLRAVVTRWAENKTINSVIGFSGTPYLDKAEKIKVNGNLSVGTAEITNIVYYYPLIDGVGNFLKHPIVKIAETSDSMLIIEKGVREFLDNYKDKVYENGLTAKLGIYCGTIEKLEEKVFPLVSRICAEYGMGSEAILKFHKGNKQYKASADSQMQFDVLDKTISKIRIVLLVQIGKEGWDCRSLTGIILSQEGDCPTNMVLQTSCRCLRQISKGKPETALIYLNDSNAEKLNVQLQMQHHISLKEFTSHEDHKTKLKRYDRTEYLKLPKVDFYQLKISYDTLVVEEANPVNGITDSINSARVADMIIKTTDLSMDKSRTSITVDDAETGTQHATYKAWLYEIMKGGFGTPTLGSLLMYDEPLREVFNTITYEKDNFRYFSSKYDRVIVESNIRKAFCDRRDFSTAEELIPEEANLLNIANFTAEITTENSKEYYPNQSVVENILKEDKGKYIIDSKLEDAISFLRESGNVEMAAQLQDQSSSHKNKNHSFHYLPYHTDSDFEQVFLKEVLTYDEIEHLGLEVYYNGDRALTEFKIKCYRNRGGMWSYIGMYTPDFLIIKRREGKIHKAIIVETKGSVYSTDPTFREKKLFMETEFTKQNNSAFGYDRFEYLYLEDTISENERLEITHRKMCDFFKED